MASPTPQAQSIQRQKAVLLALLVTVVVGVCGYLYQLPWASKELDVGFSEEARRNPYLAAESFLRRHDVEVNAESGLKLLDNLPPTSDTLLIASSRRSMSEKRVDSLMQWVDDGGALILLADDLYDDDRDDGGDRLLNDLGVGLYEGELYESVTGDETASSAPSENLTPPKTFADLLVAAQKPVDHCKNSERREGLTHIAISGEPQELLAEMSPRRHLYFEDELGYDYAGNRAGAQLVRIELGSGQLYVMTSLSQWKNKNIGCLDHAHLLRSLTKNTNTLWLMFNTDIEPIHKLIWNQRPIAVCLLFLWLALWIWRSALRTTRIEAELPKERRELMEHIAGVSRFLFQQQELDVLLADLREECVPAEGLHENITRWAERLDISEHQIQWALTAKIAQDTRELTSAVTILQSIRALTQVLPRAEKETL